MEKAEDTIIEKIQERPNRENLSTASSSSTEKTIISIEEFMLGDGQKDEVDKYTMFNEWCRNEGVIAPKLEFPAYFEDGLLGVRCKEDIQHREVYLYVPYKMLLSVKDTHSHPVLGKIVAAHPRYFSDRGRESWEQLTLALRLVYEITLGKASYWYPYIRLMPDV